MKIDVTFSNALLAEPGYQNPFFYEMLQIARLKKEII
jgi:hypothetical protein